MSRKLTRAEAEDLGIAHLRAKLRNNGELQARIVNNGVGASVTILPPGKGGWQSAHRHDRMTEVYFVLEGRILIVELSAAGTPFPHKLGAGDRRTVDIGAGHTVYVEGGAKFVTTKYPVDPNDPDWHACPELDRYIKRNGTSLVERHLGGR